MRECKDCGRCLDESDFSSGTNWRQCKKCKAQQVLIHKYVREGRLEVIENWRSEGRFEYFQDHQKYHARRRLLLRVQVTGGPSPRSRRASVERRLEVAAWMVVLLSNPEAVEAIIEDQRRERTRAHRRAWNDKMIERRRLHPEIEREKVRAKRAKRPDHYKALDAAKAARRRGASRSRTVPLNEVWDKTEGICGLCGEPCDPNFWHADHIIPIAKGGEHSLENLQPAHPYCNLMKGSKPNDTIPATWLRDTRAEWEATAGAKRMRNSKRAPCGTVQRYWKGCRCRPCTDARAQYGRDLAARKAAQ